MGKPLLCRFGMHGWVNQGTAESGHLRLECRCGASWLRRPVSRRQPMASVQPSVPATSKGATMQLQDGTLVVMSTVDSGEGMEAAISGRLTVTEGILTLTDGKAAPALLLLPRNARPVPGDPAGVRIGRRTVRIGDSVAGAGGGVTRPSTLLPEQLPPNTATWPIVALQSVR
jgi:hypothetical protein